MKLIIIIDSIKIQTSEGKLNYSYQPASRKNEFGDVTGPDAQFIIKILASAGISARVDETLMSKESDKENIYKGYVITCNDEDIESAKKEILKRKEYFRALYQEESIENRAIIWKTVSFS